MLQYARIEVQKSYNGPKLRRNSIAVLQEQTCYVHSSILSKPEANLNTANRDSHITVNTNTCTNNTERSSQLYVAHHDCHGNKADILSVR
jgi:hypothetical protein